MVAFDRLGLQEQALEDAGAVLTMEPNNQHALLIVEKKRNSFKNDGSTQTPQATDPENPERLHVLFFSENNPLQCYACLRSLLLHANGVCLSVDTFWCASEPACLESYQLLQTLPEISKGSQGSVSWIDISGGQLFDAFARTINRHTAEGVAHVLLLSDTTLFHSDFDATAALNVLRSRSDVFAVRLDVNPRVEHFCESDLFSFVPQLQPFAKDDRILLWTRWYDKSKPAYEAVPRECGWNAILDWTASILRIDHVQHFFSALVPPPASVKDLDSQAADWLSRRQRMKQSEVCHRSACYARAIMVTLGKATFGDVATSDNLLRAHLMQIHSDDVRFASKVGWTPEEVTSYFGRVRTKTISTSVLRGLCEPERYKLHYLSSSRAPKIPLEYALPKALDPPAPLVSWLVPARNAASFLRDCIRSIESQRGVTMSCCEVILVEDASDDETLALARCLAAQRPNMIVVENPTRQGVARCLREGWGYCRGEFVVRLDADDEAEPERLLTQLRYLEQHPTISVVGGQTREFWSEERKCMVDNVVEKTDGRAVVAVWRESHNRQTSRKRELLTLVERDGDVTLIDGPADYRGCRILRIDGNCLDTHEHDWRSCLRVAQGCGGEIILQRRDPLEPPTGVRFHHPILVRAALVFDDCICGTTTTLRRRHFFSGCPYKGEEAEGHWSWLSLKPDQHVANVGDVLVHSRRHERNRASIDQRGIYEDQCAAVQHFFRHVLRVVDFDMHDAAAVVRCRGPRTSIQGAKVLDALRQAENYFLNEYIRPSTHGDFWADFVQGDESALVQALLSFRLRFQAVADDVSTVITKVADHSPRQHRERELPR
eukprot:TRINITY_DN61170_c0_g1_i1.p1 TRINITY_DN61170_c0_g1~~TRINITY_DN61170_c0_g1_i1.p1  ORF type:complete len:952 (-),score=123.66 TRINITY_DN61170_c0_g1_i1:59-2554(-)